MTHQFQNSTNQVQNDNPERPAMVSIQKVPNAVASMDAPGSPPLKTRLQINRENALKSTGPKSEAGKAKSRINAAKHGLTSQIALPQETIDAISVQFWQLIMAYRPTNAVGVNAIFDLSQCYWKNRVLFEQFASQNAILRNNAFQHQHLRQQRLANLWFSRLRDDPQKAMGFLVQTPEGLQRITDALKTLIDEMKSQDASWSTTQFETAVNFCGYSVYDIWDSPAMRQLWSAWYGCFSDRSLFQNDSFRYLMPGPEFDERVRKARESAPAPAESRRFLLGWAEEMMEKFMEQVAEIQSKESGMEQYAMNATVWPGQGDSFGHLLHLRYSNQVDKKTRELLKLIEDSPRHHYDFSYEFKDELLPGQWREELLKFKPENKIMTARRSEYHQSEPGIVTSPGGWLTYNAIDQGLEETVNESQFCAEELSLVTNTDDTTNRQTELKSHHESRKVFTAKQKLAIQSLNAILDPRSQTCDSTKSVNQQVPKNQADSQTHENSHGSPNKKSSDADFDRQRIIESLNTIIEKLKIEIAAKQRVGDPSDAKCKRDLIVAQELLLKLSKESNATTLNSSKNANNEVASKPDIVQSGHDGLKQKSEIQSDEEPGQAHRPVMTQRNRSSRSKRRRFRKDHVDSPAPLANVCVNASGNTKTSVQVPN